jgi:hypothetical protein
MMKKIAIFVVLGALLTSCQIGQKKDVKSEVKPDFKEALVALLIEYPQARLNNENDMGKIGFCAESSPNGIIVGNYMGNQIIGKFEVFNRKNGAISYSDSIVNGISVGPIKAFHNNGNLAYSIRQIEKVDTIINSDYYKDYNPELRGYLKIYNEKGVIIEEGTAYYDESIELDFFKGKNWRKIK